MTRMCICCKYRVNKYTVSDISFYGFPRDDKLLEKWLLAIGTEKKVSESSRICSRHFKEDDFRYSLVGGKRFLKREVVPSLYLDGGTGDNQLCNNQAIPKENQSINIVDNLMETAESKLLRITKSQVETRKDDPLSYIIGERNETSEFISHECYNKPQISEGLTSTSDPVSEQEKKCKRYLYDVQWEEISTSPVQAKIYWEVVIEKIRRQKLTLRTLRQKVKRLKKKILELHVQVKYVANTDSHTVNIVKDK